VRRTAFVVVVPAIVVAADWLRLEQPRAVEAALAVALLALAAAFAPSFRLRLVAALPVALAAGRIAFSTWHPWTMAARFANGFLDFYDVPAPFDPRVHQDMRGTVLVAIFVFCLALGLAAAARRPVLAVLVAVLGAGWPSTLLQGGHALLRGAAILLAGLVLLAGLTRRPVPRPALPAALVLALLGVVASTSSAVAKQEIVHWQGWDFYNRPQAPVSVSYVWDSQYGGIRFPKLKTTVFKVRGPSTSLYWRATTLDQFDGVRWVESPRAAGAQFARPDPLQPPSARARKNWVREEVTIEAFADNHLVGASDPVAFDTGGAPVEHAGYGIALIPEGLTRGFRYTAWSFAPAPGPAQLASSRPAYPAALTRPGAFLDVEPGAPAPAFGAAGRERRLAAIFASVPGSLAYEPLARVAEQVAGRARSPYAATVALESWFRSRGGFTYADQPPLSPRLPPLVYFVLRSRSGYCQYYAGAMTLMLRYLGIPAREAVGFTSGSYSHGTWTVTDHDAHAWVEVWFRGYGWLPFDPTPGRGRLSAPYSAGSAHFDLASLARLLGARFGSAGPGNGPDFPRRGLPQNAVLAGSASERAGVFGGSGGGATGAAIGSLLGLLAIVVGGVASAIVTTKTGLRRRRYLTRDPRRVAAACRSELADYLVDQRLAAAGSATLHELGTLVDEELSVDSTAFVAAATAARFGPPGGAAPAARRARRELRLLLRRVRGRLTPVERARGLLSLRSLGFAAKDS
jgi:transglutaminase-like putative cysteine protease